VDALDAARGRASAGGDVVCRDGEAIDAAAAAELARALDTAEEAVLAGASLAPVACGTSWAMARPLPARDARAPVLGALAIARRHRSFSVQEQELFGYLASQAAVSVQNALLHEELRRQATIDELTGLSNHRHLQQALDEELERSRRFPAPLSLLILDIDDFKSVNDTHGHLQGDLVLREVAAAVRSHCRRVDEPARYGGEELAVMLRGTRIDGAHSAGETIRRAIEALRIPLPSGGAIRVTASVGVAELDRHEISKNRLIAAADAALYEAKRSGKNRTVVATPERRR
jgi:diguanylate cyclase (GGDEF)-like protein